MYPLMSLKVVYRCQTSIKVLISDVIRKQVIFLLFSYRISIVLCPKSRYLFARGVRIGFRTWESAWSISILSSFILQTEKKYVFHFFLNHFLDTIGRLGELTVKVYHTNILFGKYCLVVSIAILYTIILEIS